ncbi:helix-turn-helix domain-containing protein [Streptomyces sp. NRRL F-2890]|uniref:AlbA family DNA-binding domain-containing protein n=1 Tax=Streptomyces sp. NRRL F-2890 TaxID=1463845 RepID=UPI0004C8228C|nr:ATP-binding protein [Streptomyces sp. NRRL F-2890]
MVTRLGRIEGLFGRRLDELDYRSLADLVGLPEAAEGEDLDYKQDHYRQDDRGREELAKDIAAFANHTGGLLVIGMAENKGVPSKVFDVELDDARLRHIRQVIVSNTAPPVPYEPIRVHNPEAPGTGFLLLAVPRSPAGPHAVTAPVSKPLRDALRYPRRGGSRTEWLTETDVATAYRARFTAATDREQRLADVEKELVEALSDRTTPHLIVTVVPEQAGNMVIDTPRFARYRTELLETPLFLGQPTNEYKNVWVGPRRLVLRERSLVRSNVRAELHRDGSATIGMPLYGRIHVDDYDDAQLHTAEPGDIVYPLLCALPFLATHARDRAGASGLAQASVTLVADMAAHPTRAGVIELGRPGIVPFRVDQINPETGRPVPLTRESYPHATAVASVLLDDLADRGRGLLQATALLGDELLQTYGSPETGLITRDGELNPARFSEVTSGAVTDWAHQQGLLNSP